MEQRAKKPEWLDRLVGNRFFGTCEHHRELRKSDTNNYCIDCDETMCQHCLLRPNRVHSDHRLLQIRRYVYQDVVRVHDVHKLLDYSKIQAFVVNGAKVILLNPKRNSKASGTKDGARACGRCGRTISEPNQYCSIACKFSDEGADVVESERSDSPLLSSITADVGNSECWCSARPKVDGEGKCEKKVSLRKRKRKGVPRRSSFF